METCLSKNISDIVCPDCKAILREHVGSICIQWNLSQVRFTSYHAIDCRSEERAAFIAYDLVWILVVLSVSEDTLPMQFEAEGSALLHTMSAPISPS